MLAGVLIVQAEGKHHNHKKTIPKAKDADFHFPAFHQGMGLRTSPLIKETSSAHYKKHKSFDDKMRKHLMGAWHWNKAQYWAAVSGIKKTLFKIQAQPITDKKLAAKDGVNVGQPRDCEKGADPESLLMNACLIQQIWSTLAIAKDTIECKDKEWTPQQTGKCWITDANIPMTQCCHHKLDPKSCEADLFPILKRLEKKVRPAYKKCTGWWYRDGCSGGPMKCSKKQATSDPKSCKNAAQQALYLVLDMKALYLDHVAKSGGIKAQCNMDGDDDWFPTGDHRWGKFSG